MANTWFRVYAEFANDPKVQMMTEAMQRRYIMLMCFRCSNVTETLHETEIAFALRITDEELAETKCVFLAKGFIDDEWNLLNWDKRQFASDSSAERVARHRAKLKEESNADVTLQKRQGNALDTDTDTYKHTCEKSHFEEFWKVFPKIRRTAKTSCLKKWKAKKLDTIAEQIIADVRGKAGSWGEFAPAPMTYLNQERWLDGDTPGGKPEWAENML
jgi:hypothetical protein